MKAKKTIIIYLVLLAVSLILCFIFYGIYRKNTYQGYESRGFDEIKKSRCLNIVTTYNNMCNGGVEDIRIKTKKISDSLGLEVRITFEDNYKKALDQLLRGETDILAFYTPKISNVDTTHIMFIENKIINPVYLVQRNDSATMINTQNELANKTITLPLGSEYKIFVNHLSDYIGENINISYDSLYNYEQLILKVSLGKIDYTLCPNDLKERLSDKIADVNMDIPLSYDIMGGWIIRKNCKELKSCI